LFSLLGEEIKTTLNGLPTRPGQSQGVPPTRSD
jgi:hypothetical protein